MEKSYTVLGLTTDASAAELKSAYLKLSLKWHPEKNTSGAAKRKFREITDAYEHISKPVVRRVEGGHVVKVALDMMGTAADAKGYLSKLWPGTWFSFGINDKLDDAVELFSEYMYDGDLGDFFKDSDDNLHVIVRLPLARALIGGNIEYNIPRDDGTSHVVKEEISGVLDGFWRPMKSVNVEGKSVWVIFKMILPKEFTEEEEIELRQKLLLAQGTAAVVPFIINWLRTHPKTVALAFLSLTFGGVSFIKKWSWPNLAYSLIFKR